MPRPCSICTHEQCEEINRLILEGKESYRDIARQYRVSKDAIYRHVDSGHIPTQATKAKEAAVVTKADDLLSEIISLKLRGIGLLDTAERDGDIRTAVQALKAVREILTLICDISGRLQAQQTQVNILINNPEFVQIRTLIINAVKDCPECRKRISEALKDV